MELFNLSSNEEVSKNTIQKEHFKRKIKLALLPLRHQILKGKKDSDTEKET